MGSSPKMKNIKKMVQKDSKVGRAAKLGDQSLVSRAQGRREQIPPSCTLTSMYAIGHMWCRSPFFKKTTQENKQRNRVLAIAFTLRIQDSGEYSYQKSFCLSLLSFWGILMWHFGLTLSHGVGE